MAPSYGAAVRQRLSKWRRGSVPVTEVEQILEGRTEQVHHHHVVVALHGERADGGDAHAAAQDLVQLRLVQQLRVLALDRLELDGHLLSR
jgi:hypothetical protein